MPSPGYCFEKINEAISKPKSGHAELVAIDGYYINNLLSHYKESLSEDDFLEATILAKELREYIQNNYRSPKFRTMKYARKLVGDLKTILKKKHLTG